MPLLNAKLRAAQEAAQVLLVLVLVRVEAEQEVIAGEFFQRLPLGHHKPSPLGQAEQV
jgi:hypothetical protein